MRPFDGLHFPSTDCTQADNCNDLLGPASLLWILMNSGEVYLPRTMSIPLRMRSTLVSGIFPTCSVSVPLSIVTICDTFATESLGSPVVAEDRRTFPGASAQARLLVRGTHIAVPIRLRFIASPCMITTGRLKPGDDPVGSERSAHQTSPRRMLTTALGPRL